MSDVETSIETGKKKGIVGRPKGRFNPKIDWALAESLYVNGEQNEDGDIIFPSFTQIAKRTGTTGSNVHARSKRFNWPEMRAKALEARGFAPPIIPGRTLEQTPGPTPPKQVLIPRARPARTKEQILEASVALFDKNLRKGRVRMDNVGDLDKAVRLLAFVRGEADSRKAVHTTLSISVLQSRHNETKRTLDVASAGGEVAGLLAAGGAGSLEGEEERDVIDVVGVEVEEPVSGWALAANRAAASDE